MFKMVEFLTAPTVIKKKDPVCSVSSLLRNCSTGYHTGGHCTNSVKVHTLEMVLDIQGHLELPSLQPSGHYMYRKFNIQQLYILSTECVYVFCVDLRTNSDYFTVQHWLLGFYNRDGVRLLRGTFYITRSAPTVYLCVLCGSENKQRLFHCTALTGWFL